MLSQPVAGMGMGGELFDEYKVSVLQDEKMDGCNGFITSQMYLKSLNWAFKMVMMVNLCHVYFAIKRYTNKVTSVGRRAVFLAIFKC